MKLGLPAVAGSPWIAVARMPLDLATEALWIAKEVWRASCSR